MNPEATVHLQSVRAASFGNLKNLWTQVGENLANFVLCIVYSLFINYSYLHNTFGDKNLRISYNADAQIAHKLKMQKF